MKKNALNECFWDKVKGFIDLLKPIATAITFIESDELRISSVIGIFRNIKNHLDRTLPSCPLSKSEEMTARAKIAKKEQFAICDVHKICNLLDPKKRGCDLMPNEEVIT